MTTNANVPREIYICTFGSSNELNPVWDREARNPDIHGYFKYILHSEYEALLEEKERVRLANIDCVDWYNQIREENKALQQQVESLTKDAERYGSALERIANQVYDEWTNGFIAGEIAKKALNQQSKG